MSQADIPNIEIRRVARLLGPNIWSNRSVLEVWVDLGAFEQMPSNRLDGFTQRLMAWLPSLIEHRCSEGVRGGFLSRLREGTWLGHVLEHVTLELQSLAHAPVFYGRARETGEPGVYRVVVECLQPEFAERCLTAGVGLVHAAAWNEPFDVTACVQELQAFAKHSCLDPCTQMIVAAAHRQGFPAIRLASESLVQLGYGRHGKRVWSARTGRTAAVADAISKEPELTNRILAGVGLPVVDRVEVDGQDRAWEACAALGDQVVVRPAGLTLESWAEFDAVVGEDAVRLAYEHSAVHGSGVMVQRWVPGRPYRVLVIGESAVAVSLVGPVEGASSSPLQQRDVTAELYPEFHAELASGSVLAAHAIGLDVAAVEWITPDLRRPLLQSGGAIYGMDANPDLCSFVSGSEAAQRIGEVMVRHLFDGGVDPEFKVLSVSGGGVERSAIAALLAFSLGRYSGRPTGLLSARGAWFGERRVSAADARGFDAGLSALTHPTLDAAVFEGSAAQVLEQGVPFAYCNVAVVLDTTELGASVGPWDAPPYLTPELVRRAVRVPADVVPANGWLVLNGDVENIAPMAERCNGRTMYITTDPNNAVVAAHVRSGERAVVLVEGRVVSCTGASRTPLFDVRRYPALAPEVVLTSAAALLCCDVAPAVIEGYLVDYCLTSSEHGEMWPNTVGRSVSPDRLEQRDIL